MCKIEKLSCPNCGQNGKSIAAYPEKFPCPDRPTYDDSMFDVTILLLFSSIPILLVFFCFYGLITGMSLSQVHICSIITLLAVALIILLFIFLRNTKVCKIDYLKELKPQLVQYRKKYKNYKDMIYCDTCNHIYTNSKKSFFADNVKYNELLTK